ncbi:MAG: homocysteine S-methyltransferase [Candidatus Krumholzibacteria bacterium]|nr:homocysteine S-methyltransferase [Candidatus Krumholzibacteria bacterium]
MPGFPRTWDSPHGRPSEKVPVLTRSSGNPLLPILRKQTAIILAGGLATTLEDRGYDLNDDLWSARVLLEDPGAISKVHHDFLVAGADCITSATYQASIPGFKKRGLDLEQARAQLDVAVSLAVNARDDFWSQPENRKGRVKPLVAATVGPYGAFLADGSEYVGNYVINDKQLADFHRERWHILADGRADLLACETLPCLREAAVLLELLDETPDCWAWFSFTCRDGGCLCDGTPFTEAVELCATHPRVAGIGVNCTAPEFITPLMSVARTVTDLPLVAYPNSGEVFDPAGKSWRTGSPGHDLCEEAPEWLSMGVAVIGGCCRVGPEAITNLRRTLLD